MTPLPLVLGQTFSFTFEFRLNLRETGHLSRGLGVVAGALVPALPVCLFADTGVKLHTDLLICLIWQEFTLK